MYRPYGTLNLGSFTDSPSLSPMRTLLVANAPSPATADTLYKDVFNSGSSVLFGGRTLVGQALKAYRELNKSTTVDVYVLPAISSPSTATATITFTGTVSVTGVTTVSVGSTYYNKMQFTSEAGDTPTTTASKLVAAITADTNSPVTATSSAGVVTLTSVEGGAQGNNRCIVASTLATGLTITATAFTGGTGTPSLGNLLTAIAGIRYWDIVVPENLPISAISTEMGNRFDINNVVLQGKAIQPVVGSLSSIYNTVYPLNTAHTLYVACKTISTATNQGNTYGEHPYLVAVRFAAIDSLRMVDGADLALVNTTQVAQDLVGGLRLGALPFSNSKVKNMSPIIEFTEAELETLKQAGTITFGNSPNGNLVIIGDTYTPYKTDFFNNPDPAFKTVENVNTSFIVAEYFFKYVQQKGVQKRLDTDDQNNSAGVVTPSLIRAWCEEVYETLSSDDYLLISSSAEAIKEFQDTLTIQIIPALRKVIIDAKVRIVTQFGEFVINLKVQQSKNVEG